MKKKKAYEIPYIKVIKTSEEDIVCTSGGGIVLPFDPWDE